MISSLKSTTPSTKSFERLTRRQLKLIYTYSHLVSVTKPTSATPVRQLLGAILHKHWLRSYQTSPSFLIRVSTLPKLTGSMFSLRSFWLQGYNHLCLHCLYVTAISYNSSRLLLATLLLTPGSLLGVTKVGAGHVRLDTSVLSLFLNQLRFLHTMMGFLHYSYTSIFTHQSFSALRALSLATPKLTSPTKSRNTLPLIFRNIRYL